jgi:hypothetical protein
MQPRRTAPHHTVEYFLDGAQECDELDGCTAMVLRLYGNDEEALSLIDEPDSPQFRGYRHRRQICLRLCEMADGILEQLPSKRQQGLAWTGLVSTLRMVDELAETLSNWAIDDEIEGGDMVPFRRHQRAKNGIPFKRTSRRLRAPRFIRRYVRQNAPEHADHLRALAAISLRRASIFGAAEDRSIMQDWRVQINAGRPREPREKKRDRRARKVVLRSLRTAINIVGDDMVRAFLRGEPIQLAGRESMLVVKKRGSLADRGPGCLSVGLADRTGVMLADLCTFVENTPTLDQLSAFALWMRAGEERQVLSTANIVSLEAAASDHPLIVQRRQEQIATAADDLRRLQQIDPEMIERIRTVLAKPKHPFVRQLSYEEQRARNNAYWEETKEWWRESLLTFVFGRAAKRAALVTQRR